MVCELIRELLAAEGLSVNDCWVIHLSSQSLKWIGPNCWHFYAMLSDISLALYVPIVKLVKEIQLN